MLKEEERRKSRNRLQYYRPYKKQIEFHAAGATYRERLFRASNQSGKTLAGGAEVAMHLSGRYPEWWDGKRFDRPVRFMAGSESAELTRKGVQRILVGTPEDRAAWGTGMIPGDCIIDHSSRSGVADALASITVKSEFGGNSSLQFASYDQGRSKWQAETLDGVWFDEEPPSDVYSEGVTRTNTTMGPVILTLTPLMGMSEVVRRFMTEESPDRCDINMTIEDAEHYTPEERVRIIASYPEHERDARTKGIPILGSGRIFPVTQESISVGAFYIPDHWPVIGAIDFGWDHPTAAVRHAWDRDGDCIYVTHAHRLSRATPVIHAATLKAWGAWLPWVWPHDGLQHDKGSGEQIASQYRDLGLGMCKERVMFEDGTNGVEAGLSDMLTRMQTGRFKVFSHLSEWFEEFLLYHRKDGRVVKEYDDLISASRYGVMGKRFATTKPVRRVYAGASYGAPRDSVVGI